MHAPPPVPHSVPPAAPVWQSPLASPQQPWLHARVTPETTHVLLHAWLATSHAWLTGQSAVVLHPHLPAMHWLEPVQGPHVAPFVPQAWLEVAVMQLPVLSQQPLGQLVGVHFGPHVPAVHVSVAPHGTHDTPLVPQLVSPEVSHWPVAEQQPAAHVVGVQGTLASPPSPASAPPSPGPVSGEPLSVGVPSVVASAGAPSAVASLVASCPPASAVEPPSLAAESPPATLPSAST